MAARHRNTASQVIGLAYSSDGNSDKCVSSVGRAYTLMQFGKVERAYTLIQHVDAVMRRW